MLRCCRPLALIAAGLVAGEVAHAQPEVAPHAGMLRYPDVGRDSIVFVYANDLWVVDRNGGLAVPLASPPGGEQFPKFSADGKTIAFMGNYDGGRDLYTIPVDGGLPQRLTHHPAQEVLCDWTADGRLLFFAFGVAGIPTSTQLFTVAADGGLPTKLAVPYGAIASISPDGDWLAYTPHTRDHRTWKRYRGGMATDIWLFNLRTSESRKITDWEGTDSMPMWQGRTIYYVSDNGPEARLNIWSYDADSGQRRQVTHYDDYDVKWPSIGPGPNGTGEIVFQNGSDLRLLDLRTKRTRTVEVTVPGARPAIRPKRVDASEHARWWHISATGKRAVVEARGDIWTLPAENGSPRNLTRTSGVAEREASWSPDGRWIAYFSDATGEYEMYVTQSDGKGETRQLTSGSQTWYYDPIWSPDSKSILTTDKAGNLFLTTVETAETRQLDKNPWGQMPRASWSHDSRWVAYSKANEDRPVPAIWLYDTEADETHQVTSAVFPDTSPTFDRKGDYLYFASARAFSPTYSDIDTTFVYRGTQVLLAVPLREDVESPWLAESDEEEWSEKTDDDEEETDDGKTGEDEDAAAEGEGADADQDEGEGDQDEPAEDDGVSGTWEGSLSGGQIPPDMEFSLTIWLGADGTIAGHIMVPMGSGEIEGTYDADTGDVSGTITTDEGDALDFTGRLAGGSLTMTVTFQGEQVELKGTRTRVGVDEADKDESDSKEAAEIVEIDLEGFESRALQLPVGNGNFGSLAVNDKSQLLYARFKPDGLPEIMLFDIDDDKKQEKSVAKGAAAYELSGDGKKLLLLRQGGASIQNASAGATGKPVPTAGMMVSIDPREEWRQLFVEAWRLQRDFFYVANMHGVDWSGVRYQYEKMLDDCATREDLAYVIREMISELNIGHAYYFGGDFEDQPAEAVGLLGVDWELHEGAYRIAKIHEGAAWDVDARGPLSEPGVDVAEGDYLLAVNGVAVDTARDPCAAFLGMVGRPVTLTVSATPVMDEAARDVVVRPIGSEHDLRYRAWIEHNRRSVEEKSGGRVGYIYVPNTGVNGQNDLYRQFIGQAHKAALIIDERWNGGGQIPTRFIELLNRPVTNYWARRDVRDWKWPPDAHHGPKCMLINGLAGSGGDMFPWLFRQAGLGKLIGTRTWGGLVGISGNPGLIDGAGVTVPTFGFYEKDGTWGVEGHGVDPDIEVLDDPAKMVNGGDPQLDVAVDLMLEEIEKNPYVPPKRPGDPDRSGMGITDEDK